MYEDKFVIHIHPYKDSLGLKILDRFILIYLYRLLYYMFCIFSLSFLSFIVVLYVLRNVKHEQGCICCMNPGCSRLLSFLIAHIT